MGCVVLSFASGCASNGKDDPWERMNRGTFAFNEGADKYVIEPVAKGWDFVVPELAQTGLMNFFENLRMPAYLMNNLLQGQIESAVIELFRFTLNSTFGLAGFIDVASLSSWPHYPEDFGLTLGHWGVPQGPYLVLPIFGPSSPRATTGLIVDGGTAVYTWFVPIYVPIGARTVDLLNDRAIFLEEIAQSREEAFDFYVFVRNAYLQNRRHKLLRRGPAGARTAFPGAETPSDEDLYFFDDEEDDLYDDSWDDGGDGGAEGTGDGARSE